MQKIQCYIYRTPQREDLYLYLRQAMLFDDLPQPLRQLFADRVEVLTLTLTAATRLAREDAKQVFSNLQRDGYHLQLPAPAGDGLVAASPKPPSSGK